jgi:hypothetical protein
MKGILAVIRYIENRLLERSFWGDVLIGVSAAALLPKPWNYVFVGLSAIKAMVPDGSVKPAA